MLYLSLPFLLCKWPALIATNGLPQPRYFRLRRPICCLRRFGSSGRRSSRCGWLGRRPLVFYNDAYRHTRAAKHPRRSAARAARFGARSGPTRARIASVPRLRQGDLGQCLRLFLGSPDPRRRRTTRSRIAALLRRRRRCPRCAVRRDRGDRARDQRAPRRAARQLASETPGRALTIACVAGSNGASPRKRANLPFKLT